MTRFHWTLGILSLLAASSGQAQMPQTGTDSLLASPEESGVKMLLTADESVRPIKDTGKDGKCIECAPLCPDYYGNVDFLYLQRTNCSREQPIVVSAGETPRTFLSTQDFNFNMAPGIRALIGARLHDCWAIEGGYLGMFNADASQAVVRPNPNTFLTFPGPLGPVSNVFFGTDRFQVNYTSNLNAAEINLVCCRCASECDKCDEGKGGKGGGCSRSIEFLGGFSYINLNEGFNIYGERDEIGGTETGVYNVSTTNNLYGAQIGARLRGQRGRLACELGGKMGLYLNDATETQYVTDFPNYPLRPTISGHTTNAAFAGQIDLTGIYCINDTWGLRFGYTLIGVQGVALAPDQLDFTNTPTSGSSINTDGGMIAHGFTCGLEARF